MISDKVKGSKLNKLRVSPEMFEKQLKYLKGHGYTSINFKELIKYINTGSAVLPDNPVIITFDDGYHDNYTNALPLLKKYGFKATVFLVVDKIGSYDDWINIPDEPHEKLLTREQILDMYNNYGIEFGSHSCTHKILTEMNNTNELEYEIYSSKQKLTELLGEDVVVFCYPYGKYNTHVIDMAKNAGYYFACGIKQGVFRIGDNLMCMHRILIRGDDCMLDFIINIKKGRSRI
jgi:peptidoglycan/xylan/chitin deacetylase (PgdA/CDA1 family)